MRGDTTVVEANIHPPTDSSILSDGVRGVCRAVRKVAGVLAGVGEGFQDVTRRVRGMLLEVVRVGRQKTEAAKQKLTKVVGKIADLASGVAPAAASVVEQAKEKMAETDWKVFGFNLRKLAEKVMGRGTRRVATHVACCAA